MLEFVPDDDEFGLLGVWIGGGTGLGLELLGGNGGLPFFEGEGLEAGFSPGLPEPEDEPLPG